MSGVASAKAVLDLERLIECCEAGLERRVSSKAGRLKLASAVEKMELLLPEAQRSARSDEESARLGRAVGRLRGVLEAAPSSVRLASASTELGADQKRALVAAAARTMAARRDAATDELFATKVPWHQFASASSQPPNSLQSSSVTDDLLAYHKQEHERLSEDMLVGATMLSQASRSISETLAKDAATIKELDDVQSENRAVLAKEKDRIKKQTSRTCRFTLITIGVCVVVLIVFMWMVMMIRLTSKSK
jgi:hypothetical protein